MPDDFQIAYNLQRMRISTTYGSQHASDRSLAALLNVSQSCTTKWRRGERQPSGVVRTAVLEKLADYVPQ